MNEGDVVVVFSQYGEVADICLMRDKKTKKSRGFAYLAYVDQRTTDVAVDNLNGALVCGRYIKVDHVRDYKLPKEAYILEPGETPESKAYRPTGPDGMGWGNFRNLTEQEEKQIQELAEEVEHSKAVAQAKQARYNDTMFISQADQDKLFEENQEKMEMQYQNKDLIKIRKQYQQLLEEKQRRKEAKKAKKEKKKEKKNDKKEKRERLEYSETAQKGHKLDSQVESRAVPVITDPTTQIATKPLKKRSRSSSASSDVSVQKANKKKKKHKEKSKKKDKSHKRERSRSKDKKRKDSSDSEDT